MMSYEEFEKEIVENIEGRLSEEQNAVVKPVFKNNGLVLHGLVISNSRCNISPTIYLDYYYERLKNGYEIDELADMIMKQYDKFALDDDFDITIFTDFEKCKSNISYKLINYEKNIELLRDIPHIVYLDLAIVFYCLLDDGRLETSSILIKNIHMEHWGIDVNELFDIASKNTPKLLESEIKNLSEIIRGIVQAKGAEMDFPVEYEDESPMYVLTNKLKLYGACCILYKHLLEEFADSVNTDLYIIPSSVHEVLLIPKRKEYDAEYLSELCKEVNATELSPEEVLSDHIYYYSRKDNAITY